MNLFRIDGRKLVPLDEASFDLEVELQKITEANLQAVFGLEFVASEYNLRDCYFDTLAFNPETKAFEIIEFKKQTSLNVMEQGQTYLNLVLEYKEKVLLDYDELKNRNFKLKDIDWTATRVKFIAPNFTRYQIGALNPKTPFELYEVKKYGLDIVGYERIQPLISSQVGKPMSLTGKAGKEIIVNAPADIIAKTPPFLKDSVRAIEEKALELGSDVEEQAGKSSISFKTKKKTFLQIWLYKDHIQVSFPYGNELTDNKNLLRGIGKTGRYINISSGDKITGIEDYIKQAYQNSV
jgi:predicted transport protein